MQLPPLIKQLDKQLEGEPDSVLTGILFGLAGFAILVGMFGSPSFKAALAAWFIAP